MSKYKKFKKPKENKSSLWTTSVSSLKWSTTSRPISFIGSALNSLKPVIEILETHQHMLEAILSLVNGGLQKSQCNKDGKIADGHTLTLSY